MRKEFVALAFVLCAASHISANDCGNLGFQLSNFQNVYIFNMMCKNTDTMEMSRYCQEMKAKDDYTQRNCDHCKKKKHHNWKTQTVQLEKTTQTKIPTTKIGNC
jgi:hypothetical protein